MTKLYEEALKLSVQEEIRNIRTLLNWAMEANDLDETVRHADQAHRLLTEVCRNLAELQRS